MVFEKIQEIIAEELGKETEEIKLTTDIQEDLEADSLDLFQIINEIEDEFDVKIETEDGIKTVQDILNRFDSVFCFDFHVKFIFNFIDDLE